MSPWIVLAAAALEGVVGYPRRWRHPVALPAFVIHRLERDWNRPLLPRRSLGVILMILLLAAAVVAGLAIEQLPWPFVVAAGAFGMAGRSLYDHVHAVASALMGGDLTMARLRVARIVGRDTGGLDEAGVSAAALESLAESFSDGLIAPVFWFLVAGLPGLFAYKAVNTADSLIGHREDRYRRFGWAAARTDDLMNLIPARITGLLVVLAAGRGVSVLLRDAGKHASPNAGWPEAAMAGGLAVSLGGPAAYDGVVSDRAVLGYGPPPAAADLGRGVTIYLRACAIAAFVLILGGVVWPFP